MRRALLNLGVILGITLLSGFAYTSEAERPSWFPRAACKDAWSGRDRARYDFASDTRVQPGVGNVGYANYQSRIRQQGAARKNCYKEWAVLVYMAADNDLSPYALWDLHEMEGAFASGNYAGSTLKSDLIVQVDSKGRTGIRRLHVFQKPGRDYTVPQGVSDFQDRSPSEVASPIVTMINEPSAVTGREHRAKLKEFLDWGMREYPAERYFVVVWGHGQGWAAEPSAGATAPVSRFVTERDLPITFDSILPERSSVGSSDSPLRGRFGGLAFGEGMTDYLSVPALSGVLEEVVRDTLEGRRLIDIYASDACLMQMTEVAYEISKSVRFVVGSSQVQTFLGLPYRQLMYQLNTGRLVADSPSVGRGDETYLLARALPLIAERALDPRRGHQGQADLEAIRSFTISALSAADLRNQLVPSLRYLGARLSAYLREDPLRSMDLRFLTKNAPGFMGGSRELGSFVSLLRIQLQNEAETIGGWTPAARTLFEATDLVRGAIRLTVVSSGYGTGYREARDQLHLLGFSALGIWLPYSPQEYTARHQDFEKSAFFSERSRDSWGGWIRTLFAQ